ncbi:hypothetical protein [Paraburkholderia phytofirmans]|nr:hypothetical protein [Paraburkholderia phytofirmans]
MSRHAANSEANDQINSEANNEPNCPVWRGTGITPVLRVPTHTYKETA